MDNSDVIKLLQIEHPADDDGAQQYEVKSSRKVYCEIKSVGMKEVYEAQAVGHNPELKVVLSEFSDYEGENYVLYNDVIYSVVRTYRKNLSVEITLERDRYIEGPLCIT